MSEFLMPSLGADMEAGTLVEWMKHPGDHLQRGDAIAAVETQKGAIEIEVFESGILDEIRVQVGQRVPVGTVLAIIRSADEATTVAAKPVEAPAEPAATGTPARPAAAASTPPTPPPPPMTTAEAARARITPAARRRAQELHIDLSGLQPGADGVIGLREVEAAGVASAGQQPAIAATAVPAPSGRGARPGIDRDEMRKAIAAAMARSWREIPHYFVGSIIDVEPMLAWLEHENAQRPVPQRLHYAALLIKATARALKAEPMLNGHHLNGVFTPSAQVHLGIAVAMRGGGLIAPAMLDVDTLELAEVMA
ncbi:MAG: 2-oxo acid dehydrogenase subunit E2, partial [Rhodanobacter sp.]|nr:2-oxo acid dehydrogenase subunit E2 [Rhodanobacter sp.]